MAQQPFQNQRRRRNWFSNQEEQNKTPNCNFLDKMTKAEIQRAAPTIIRDIARGNIDIRQYAEYFAYPGFIDSLIESATIKFNFHNISYIGVATALSMNVYTDTDRRSVESTIAYHNTAKTGYWLAINCLTNYKLTGEIEYIVIGANDLNKYRYSL